MTNTGPPTPAMRLSVAWICGSRMASQLALPLSNRRYAPCVLAQSPQASLIGEAGELTSCSAVLIKRRSKRLSDRSTPANSSHTHSTDAVPASMIACTSGSSHRAVLAKQPATLRRTSRRTQGYQMSAAVSSAPYAALSLTAQRSRLVWNRQGSSGALRDPGFQRPAAEADQDTSADRFFGDGKVTRSVMPDNSDTSLAPNSFRRVTTSRTSTSGAEAPAVTRMRALPATHAGYNSRALSTI